MTPNDGLPGGSTVIERPPPGLARGKFGAPAWVVASLGAAVVLSAILYVALRFVRRVKR